MTSSHLFLAALSGAFASLLPSVASAQGALTPPGAPAPLFKTLDQIEARKPIGTPNVITTSTITISEPGSYVLVGPVSIASGDGILINASDVTLDLNGFTLSSPAASGTGCGVRITGPGGKTGNVSVSNGFISGSYRIAADGTTSGTGFYDGISCVLSDSNNISATRISVRGVRRVGIQVANFSLYPNTTGIIADCQSQHTGSDGLIGPIVTDSAATDCSGLGISALTVSHCVVKAPRAAIGIVARTVTDSVAEAANTGIAASTVSNSNGSATLYAGATGIEAQYAVTNCRGLGQGFGINCENGTVSFSHGSAPASGSNRSIKAAIAVACTLDGAPIEAPQKHLGTP